MRNDRVDHLVACGLALLIAFAVPRVAAAADVVLLASNGIRPVLDEVLPQFEQSTMHKVLVRYDVAAEMRRKIEAGQTFDLAILTAGQLDAVMKGGFIVSGTRVALAQTPIAIAIRAGASRPDIRTTTALVRALQDAASITYAREGAGGVYLTQLLQKLGLTERLAPKLRPVGTGADASAAVARGDAQLGVLPLSEILPVKGVEVLGPFPADVQDPMVMVAGISAAAKQRAAATALVTYLNSPAVRPVLQKKGMEPATR
jgi:molybdate transport system substrate-binding protein